ncbi:MAG: gamma-glutamyltransferase family protein, partial [Planctomycetota bacterium]
MDTTRTRDGQAQRAPDRPAAVARSAGRLAAAAVVGTLFLLAGCCASAPTAAAPVYRHGAVAADHPVASLAGLEMLQLGGNAVDAAVATSFALSVVRPYSCGIGGGGFMIIHDPGRDGSVPVQVAIDYREVAPAAVGREYYQRLQARTGRDELSRFGPHAAGVPGTVAGLLWALEHYGTLDRETVLGPAIRAAEEGFAADRSFVDAARGLRDRLQTHPWAKPGASFLIEELCRGGGLQVGDEIRNLPQARALRLIAEHGRPGFYEGPVARAIVEAMGAAAEEVGAGAITAADLAAYRPRVMTPLRGEFRSWTVLAMPPPSSGGVAMLQIFGILQRRADVLDGAAHQGPDYVHLLAEAAKHAFADRAQWLADPDYAPVPVDRLLGEDYLDGLAASIDMAATKDRFAYGSVEPLPLDAGTSHLSVIDGRGMAVSCTETINLQFGSLVTVP